MPCRPIHQLIDFLVGVSSIATHHLGRWDYHD